jgi:hypothetical protein
MVAVTTGPDQFAADFPVARGASVVDYASLGQAARQADPASGSADAASAGANAAASTPAAAAAGARPTASGEQTHSLAAALDAVFGDDPLAEVRRELETYYLGDIRRDRYVERFLEEAGRYV